MMSDLTPALTEDMVERAAQELREWGANRSYTFETITRCVLEAALAGRVVVDLPEPDGDPGDDPSWTLPDGGHVVATVVDGKPFVVSSTPSFKPVPDNVDALALRLLAAAREARHLASESRKDSETDA